MIGRTLGHYKILDRLGTGGMGVVWLAEDLKLKRRVALKTLREDLSTSPEKLARFEREAKAVAALSHPNIVTIHSIEEADGIRFLAMEYVEGKTLDELIPPGGFPLPEFLRIAVPVADALAAAHSRGITHRDLKPGNIVVGEDGRAKVLDFGLAKLQVAHSTQIYGRELEASLTQEGTVVGTLHYMSPEQLQLKAVDHRTDIFSLGVVLYEMATGDLPFRGESAAQVISAVLRDDPRRLDDVNERLPPEIAETVGRCLEKNVDKRISSAAEVRDLLATVSRALETGVSGIGASARLKRIAGRVRRRTSPASVAGIAVLVAAMVAIPWAIKALRSSGGESTAATVAVAERPPAIAVLPLTNYSNDPEYFVDGMTDGLIGSLARIGGVRVISRQSAMHYKNSDKRLPEIALELGVDYVVEGSITRDGDRLRLQAQVVKPDPETQIWAEVFDRPLTDVLALHNDVASGIARAVKVKLSDTEEVRMASTQSVDPAVYEAYLQGRYWAGKSGEEDLRKAQGYFERAIALDSRFAPAWAGLADSLVMLGLFHTDTESTLARAESAATRAAQLDPNLADAPATLANIALARWQWELAETSIKRAIELDPNSAAARRRYWQLLAVHLRLGESRKEIELARRLDPLSAQIASNAGLQDLFEKRYAAAELAFRQALALDPDYTLTHGWLWLLYSKTKKDPERGIELRAYVAAMGFDEQLVDLDRWLEQDGYDSALRKLANRLDEKYRGDPTVVGVVGGLLAEAGELDKATSWLQLGFENRVWELPWLSITPDYENLHGRSEFKRLVESLGLPLPRG